jgi:hypothetical protein
MVCGHTTKKPQKENKMNVLNSVNTTAVDEKDIPALPEPTYHNAPEDVPSAIERIMELEMRLEDLSRAVEIAQITRQFEILEGFKSQADECLQSKIVIEQPDYGPMKITVLTNGKKQKKRKEKANV